MKNTLSIVKQWINALNSGNLESVITLSEPNVTIIGPRGVASGIDILREWYARTHLTFDVDQFLTHKDQVISLGTVHWHDDTGLEVSSAKTAFLMTISPNHLISKLSRHDEGLSAALAASNASERSAWQIAEIK